MRRASRRARTPPRWHQLRTDLVIPLGRWTMTKESKLRFLRWTPIAAIAALSPAFAAGTENGTAHYPGNGPSTTAEGVAPQPSRSAESTPIDTRFSQTADNGCVYESHVTGLIA